MLMTADYFQSLRDYPRLIVMCEDINIYCVVKSKTVFNLIIVKFGQFIISNYDFPFKTNATVICLYLCTRVIEKSFFIALTKKKYVENCSARYVKINSITERSKIQQTRNNSQVKNGLQDLVGCDLA